ncbi:hypothetical protein CMI47_20495 [Candidatus Pacearchaeota archaeon]|nr:hypothetical protein [Candidatus Pacearchaeota archaeon]|tara:strand:- start:2819 stop:3229 length:411 start_codon:yes stop_codon:yes gene_type:complete
MTKEQMIALAKSLVGTTDEVVFGIAFDSSTAYPEEVADDVFSGLLFQHGLSFNTKPKPWTEVYAVERLERALTELVHNAACYVKDFPRQDDVFGPLMKVTVRRGRTTLDVFKIGEERWNAATVSALADNQPRIYAY